MRPIAQKALAGTITLGLLFTPISYADETSAIDSNRSGFQNFKTQRDYSDNLFSDITATWVHNAVKPGYELGLLNGQGKGKFNPNANVTIAEAIALAASIHNIYTGGTGSMESVGSKWYDGAVAYAVDHGIIKAGVFTDFQKAATRAEMAEIFTHALPESQYQTSNQIDSLPDVTDSTLHSNSIFTLYRAGILSGNDDYGTFHPFSTIKRSEAAVIVGRIVNPSQRKTVTLRPFSTTSAAGTTYTSKSNRFTMTVPSEWHEVGYYSSSYNSLELCSSEDLQRISIIEAENSADETFDHFSDTFMLGIRSKLQNPSVSQYEFIQLNGVEGRHCRITGQLDGIDLSFYLVALHSGDRYYIINGCTPDSSAEKFEAEFNKYIKTWKLVQ